MSQAQFCTYLDKVREVYVVKLQTHDIERTNTEERETGEKNLLDRQTL